MKAAVGNEPLKGAGTIAKPVQRAAQLEALSTFTAAAASECGASCHADDARLRLVACSQHGALLARQPPLGVHLLC